MTMGPEPMTRIDSMSVRRGISDPLPGRGGPGRTGGIHEQPELLEQVAGVVRAGPASGWYCTLKAGTSRQRMPSTTPSFRLTWVTSARDSEPSATA